MPQLTLENNEAEILADVLESKLRDLSYQIADTDTMDFRNQLKARRDVMNKILNELRGSGD